MLQLRNRDCHGCSALSNARLQFVGHVLALSLGAHLSQAPALGNTQAKSTQSNEYTNPAHVLLGVLPIPIG
jgi:hypothetical protein